MTTFHPPLFKINDFMNGQQEEPPIGWEGEPIREDHLQLRRERMNGRVTHFKGQGLCVRVCVCVECKCLYIAVGNARRQSGWLKLAVWATCLPLTKPETERWREQEGGRGCRKRRGWGRRQGWGGGETLIKTAGFARGSFSTFPPSPPSSPSTLQHRETLLDGLDWGWGG